MVDRLDLVLLHGYQLHQSSDLLRSGALDNRAVPSHAHGSGQDSWAFQISYAVTWLLGGIFLDVVGTRLGLALAVVFWSLINMLTGFASTVFSFAAFRFLLGIGEGFNWPGASKTDAKQ
jgi:MFS family permease